MTRGLKRRKVNGKARPSFPRRWPDLIHHRIGAEELILPIDSSQQYGAGFSFAKMFAHTRAANGGPGNRTGHGRSVEDGGQFEFWTCRKL